MLETEKIKKLEASIAKLTKTLKSLCEPKSKFTPNQRILDLGETSIVPPRMSQVWLGLSDVEKKHYRRCIRFAYRNIDMSIWFKRSLITQCFNSNSEKVKNNKPLLESAYAHTYWYIKDKFPFK